MLIHTQSSHNGNCLLLTYCGSPSWGRGHEARMRRKYWTGATSGAVSLLVPVVHDADRYGCCEFRLRGCED
jgi:hypothetical protein